VNGRIEFNKSAFKHGITEEDIRYAFTHIIFDHPVTGEEEKNLLISFDTKANVLEILYNVIDDQAINVFHAMKSRRNNDKNDRRRSRRFGRIMDKNHT
jgi:hypothetical protein